MNTAQRIEVMDVQISNITETGDNLNFIIKNVDTCVVNAIRRTTLSNIDTLIFRGFPYEKSDIKMIKNTTNFNNEYLKQRIGCIPIMNDDYDTFDTFRENYKIVVNVENNKQQKVYVTTNDIDIINKTTNEKMSREKVMIYFPPDKNIPQDSITSPYILLCVLFPNQSGDETQNEAIHFESDFDIGCAKENACWNVVHNCTYEFLRDESRITKEVEKIKDESEKKDFQLLDAERIYHSNEYKMTFETLGIYSNRQIIDKSCDYIINRLKLIKKILMKQTQSAILSKDVVNAKSTDGTALKEDLDELHEQYCHLYQEGKLYILELKEDDYTIGKLIENYFYKIQEDKLQFVGFKKEHPIKPESYIYFQYKPGYLSTNAGSSDVIEPLVSVVLMINDVFEEIKGHFKKN
jgi:DNA-directed RNA polymerase subunit L/DNA-directed RNA polymerase alpha subunit